MIPRAQPCRTVQTGEAEFPATRLSGLGATAPSALALFGNAENLSLDSLAILSSVRTPPELILRTFDLARTLRSEGMPTIGGFQTPLERECLLLLLRGKQPVTVCPAHGIEGMRIPRLWRQPLEDQRLLIVSLFPGRRRRPSVRTAEPRNRLVAALASRLFILHARPGSRAFRAAVLGLDLGKPVYCFEHERNRELILLGARPTNPKTLLGMDE
jgi:predicted Rossmann fold nucleotide-binding protein DprA/Smf involved in DNA uptake